MNAVNGLVWPVIAAILLAIGGLAIKEPKKFAKLSHYLFYGGLAVLMVVASWQFGYQRGEADLRRFVSQGGQIFDFDGSLGTSLLPAGIGMGWVMFLLLASFIGQLLDSDGDGK